MSGVKHTTLKAELLYLIGRATAPMSSDELYERCELADEMKQVSNALFQLKDDEKIVRAPGEGRARYMLAPGVAAPAPAGKVGRPGITDPDAAQPRPSRQASTADSTGLPKIEIPPLGSATPQKPADKRDRATPQARQAGRRTACPSSDAALADAIIARLKRDLEPLLRPSVSQALEVTSGADGLTIHVHIDQVDVHLGGL